MTARAALAALGLLALAACVAAPAQIVPTLRPGERPVAMPPAPAPSILSERLPRLSVGAFRAAAAGVAGEWQVTTRPDTGCRLTLGPADDLRRTGPVVQRGGCLDRRLFRARDWTMTAPGVLVLLDLSGDPLAVLTQTGADSLAGEGLALVRLPPAD